MQRVIAYVDGFNLYYGLRSRGWKWFYWLNIRDMMQHMLKPNQELIYTKYFTTIVKQPQDRHERQQTFLDALQTIPDIQMYFGHFLEDTVKCNNCGFAYKTHHEKMTDVNIAVELMTDAFLDKFDLALLVSADSDLVGPVRAVQQLFNQKRVVIAFPPGRFSSALKDSATAYTHIGRNVLSKSVFPDQIMRLDGFALRRPTEWR